MKHDKKYYIEKFKEKFISVNKDGIVHLRDNPFGMTVFIEGMYDELHHEAYMQGHAVALEQVLTSEKSTTKNEKISNSLTEKGGIQNVSTLPKELPCNGTTIVCLGLDCKVCRKAPEAECRGFLCHCHLDKKSLCKNYSKHCSHCKPEDVAMRCQCNLCKIGRKNCPHCNKPTEIGLSTVDMLGK
jgi:hypothetical protein